MFTAKKEEEGCAMLKKDKRRLFRRVRRTLGRFTPLRADCGELCDRRCCSADEQTGMLLFPGERTDLPVQGDEKRRVAVCAGTCERRNRPLSCRLFPFLPVLENGKVTVQLDRRAMGVCPLVEASGHVRFSQRFLHRARRAGAQLFADEDCCRFLNEAAEEGEQTAQIFAIFCEKK